MKKITANQTLTLICLCSISVKIASLPGYMSTIAKGDFWLVALGIFISEIISLWIILDISSKVRDKTFFDLIKENISSKLSKLIEILFSIFFIVKTLICIYETEIFIKNTIYEDFNEWIFLFVFLLFLIYVSKKNYMVLGRVGELIIWVAIAGGVISLMLSVLEIDISNILPIILKNDITTLLNCAGKSSFWFGDYLIFFILMGNIKFDEDTSKNIKRILIGYSVMALFIILLFIVFECLFKNVTTIYETAISGVSHYIPRFNDFRIDWLSDIMWVIVQIYSSAVWFFLSKITLNNLFNINNSKNNIKDIYIPIIFSISIIIVFNIVKVPLNIFENFIGNNFWWVTLILSQMPLLTFICYKIYKRRNMKNENAIKE